MGLAAKTRKLIAILRSKAYCRALWRGAAAAVEHESLLRNLNCQTVVDVGANRGQFALVAHRCFPTAAIFSFEPLTEPAQIFRRVLGKEKLVCLRQNAIGPESASCEMHVSQRDDSSSLLPIGALHTRIFPGTAECRRERITVERLDNVLRRTEILPPALLKIDVQGYELEVLKGCGDLLEVFSYVYLEASFMPLYEGQPLAPEVIDSLGRKGFTLKGVFNPTYDRAGNSVQADFLFTSDRKEGQPASSVAARSSEPTMTPPQFSSHILTNS